VSTLSPPRPSPSPSLTSLRSVDPHSRRRRRRSQLMRWVLLAGMVLAVIPLLLIVAEVARRGIGAMGWSFITETEPPFRREGGGYLQGIVGTFYMVGLAALLSIPLGIMAAVYLVEFGRGWLSRIVRFFTDVMTGVPSVFVGLFIYSLLIRDIGFGSFVGALALSVIMLPIVVRSSEEMLKLVPEDQRAASAALGARHWQTIVKVVLPTARSGLVTGAMLAVARAAGETAPLLLTALGALSVVTAFQGTPQSSLTLLIYDGATQPFAAGQQRAWAGALLLLAIVFVMTALARLIGSRSTLTPNRP
jgi:phosphate transport system permease protein